MRISIWRVIAGQLAYVLALVPATWLAAELYVHLVHGDTAVPMEGLALAWLILLGPGWLGHLGIFAYEIRHREFASTQRLVALQVLTSLTAAALMWALFSMSEHYTALWQSLALYPVVALIPAIATLFIYRLNRTMIR